MSNQKNSNLLYDFLKNKNIRDRPYLNRSLNKISILNPNFPISHRIRLNKENTKTNIINDGDNDIKNNLLEPTYDIYTDYQLIKKFGPNINLINKIRNESNKLQNKCNNFNLFNLKNKCNIYNYNSNIINKKISENIKDLFKDKINKPKFKDFYKPNNTLNGDNINKYKSNNSMDKYRSNSSQKFLSNNYFYYFDYKNDNYNEIREKSKNKEISSLNNIPINNKLNRTLTDINIQNNNQNSIRNKIMSLNSQNKLITENNKKNLNISNILNDIVGQNYNIENNNNSNNYQNENKNLGENLITSLKKENEELKNENLKNNQIINSLFYFINQLSQQYSPNKKTFNYSYYSTHLNELMQDLYNLNNNINMKNGVNTPIYHMEYLSNENSKNNKFDEILTNFTFGNKNIPNYNIKKISNIGQLSNRVINNINNKDNYNIKVIENKNENDINIKNIHINNSKIKKKNLTFNENEIIHSLNNII